MKCVGHVLSNRRLKGKIDSSPKKAEGLAGSPSVHSPTQHPVAKIKPLLPSEEPAEFEALQGITVTLNTSTNWKTRADCIDAIMDIAVDSSELLGRSGKFMAVLDSLAKALTDANVRVSIKAVSALEKFVPLFKPNIEQNAMLLLGCLATNLCSTNAPLKNKSDTLIDLLVDTVENVCLVQPLVHISLYGNPRAKPTIISHLCGIFAELS